MTPDVDASLRSQVREAIEAAWKLAQAGLAPAAGGEPASAGSALADPVDSAVAIGHPADGMRVDFASNIAWKLAKPYRRAPMEIAKAIAAHVATTATDPASPIAAVEVAPPGFLNVRLSDHALAAMAQDIPVSYTHLRAHETRHD